MKPLMAQVSKVTMKLVPLPPGPLESGPAAYRIPQNWLLLSRQTHSATLTGLKTHQVKRKSNKRATQTGWKQPPQSQHVPTEGGV